MAPPAASRANVGHDQVAPSSSAQTRVHDLGGRSGFGPVPVHDDHVFASDWERRAYAITQFAQGLAGFTTDAFRHGIEREDPERYLAIEYFDKWIRNAERMLVEGGVVPADALQAHLAGSEPVLSPVRTTQVAPPLGKGAARQVAEPARFRVGDRVRVDDPATSVPETSHNRIPGYVAGRVGTVVLINDGWVFPDTYAHGQGENPCWVYAVRFEGTDLWPEADEASPRDVVHVDLFEPYLEPAE